MYYARTLIINSNVHVNTNFIIKNHPHFNSYLPSGNFQGGDAMTDLVKISTRCKISHRPPFRSAEPKFYRCGQCQNLIIQASAGAETLTCTCCNRTMERLNAVNQRNISDEMHRIEYIISGGWERNAVKASIGRIPHPMTREHHIEWVYFYTFQGGQLKYLAQEKPPEAIFAMADEDAFVYCDRKVCKMGNDQCQFQCKRGLVLYAYCNIHGLQMIRL